MKNFSRCCIGALTLAIITGVYDNAPGGHNFLFADSDEQRDCFKRTFDWLGKYLKPWAASRLSRR
jgi:hypothetical protein